MNIDGDEHKVFILVCSALRFMDNMMTMDVTYLKVYTRNRTFPILTAEQAQPVIVVFYGLLQNWVSHEIV